MYKDFVKDFVHLHRIPCLKLWQDVIGLLVSSNPDTIYCPARPLGWEFLNLMNYFTNVWMVKNEKRSYIRSRLVFSLAVMQFSWIFKIFKISLSCLFTLKSSSLAKKASLFIVCIGCCKLYRHFGRTNKCLYEMSFVKWQLSSFPKMRDNGQTGLWNGLYLYLACMGFIICNC